MDSEQQTTGSAPGDGRHALSKKAPAGYKRTEVGVIPEDWECARLGDLTTRVGSGITPSGGWRTYVTEGRPFLRSQNVGWGVLDLTDLAFITDEVHASFAASEIEEGDVLLNITGASIGRSAVANGTVARGNVNQHVCEIRPVPKGLDPRFLNSYLLSAAGQRQIDSYQAGGNRQGLNYSQIRSFVIPHPTLAEQRAIAEALSDVDGLLAALEALIAKKLAIKQAAMQQLLTGKTRLPGFSGEWETKLVADFGEIVTGATPRTEIEAFWDGRYPWITPTDISYHRDMITSERMITKEGLDAIRALPKNTVLVTCIASIGKNAILRTEGSCNQQINAVIPNAAHSAEFLYYLFELNTRYLLAKAGITATSIVSKATFGQLGFKVPFVDEQRAIAAVLSDMDAEIAALERRRDKTHAIKQGMMQQLLTGRVRLIKLESPWW